MRAPEQLRKNAKAHSGRAGEDPAFLPAASAASATILHIDTCWIIHTIIYIHIFINTIDDKFIRVFMSW